MRNPKLLASCCALSIASFGSAYLAANASELDFRAPEPITPTENVIPDEAAPVQPAPANTAPQPATDRSNSSLFGKAEVKGENFVVMAAPRGFSGDFYLMIVEQQSEAQPCWQERGAAPIEVDPLLLTFDYTGICSRMADSNAYSIRMDDRDLGLNYSIRVVPQDGELMLRGFSNSDFSAPPIDIGRTYGVSSTGFTRIVLNPGWRLTRRVYDERELGHIYLTSDLPLVAGETISQN